MDLGQICPDLAQIWTEALLGYDLAQIWPRSGSQAMLGYDLAQIWPRS